MCITLHIHLFWYGAIKERPCFRAASLCILYHCVYFVGLPATFVEHSEGNMFTAASIHGEGQ